MCTKSRTQCVRDFVHIQLNPDTQMHCMCTKSRTHRICYFLLKSSEIPQISQFRTHLRADRKMLGFFWQPKISLTKIVAYALLIIDTVSTARDTIGTRSGNQFWSISLLHFDSRAQEQRKDLIIDLDWLRFLQLKHVLQSVPLKNRDWRIDPPASSVNVQSGSFLPSLFRLDWTEIAQTKFKESE